MVIARKDWLVSPLPTPPHLVFEFSSRGELRCLNEQQKISLLLVRYIIGHILWGQFGHINLVIFKCLTMSKVTFLNKIQLQFQLNESFPKNI
jgi:hypothetical protein